MPSHAVGSHRPDQPAIQSSVACAYRPGVSELERALISSFDILFLHAGLSSTPCIVDGTVISPQRYEGVARTWRRGRWWLSPTTISSRRFAMAPIEQITYGADRALLQTCCCCVPVAAATPTLVRITTRILRHLGREREQIGRQSATVCGIVTIVMALLRPTAASAA